MIKVKPYSSRLRPYAKSEETKLGSVSDLVLGFPTSAEPQMKGKDLRLLSLFSGCGGMDIGFEGGFICNRKSVGRAEWIEQELANNQVRVASTRFLTIFANDILKEAQLTWSAYMGLRGHEPEQEYHLESIVDLVKKHQKGDFSFPEDIDIVTGGFPCQDFSVAGKRKGFESNKDHNGNFRNHEEPSEETRGMLYYWMKKVIDITRPKMFVAENVKGLVNLGDVKSIIQNDFSSAGGNGYIVLDPQVLHAGNYGVPESRERVIFIGIRRDALNPQALQALEAEVLDQRYNPYPTATHACTAEGPGLKPCVVCADVLGGLKEPNQSCDLSQAYYSHAKYMGSHCQGQSEIGLDKIGPTIRSEHHGNIEFRRLSAEHGGQHTAELAAGLLERRLTPRECALIQTFPPDYPFVRYSGYHKSRFAVTASGAYKVIGNAVPPVLAYSLARRIQELWPIFFE